MTHLPATVRLVYWHFVDPAGRSQFVRGLPFSVELRGRTPARLHVNQRHTAATVVRVLPSGVLHFKRYGCWTDADSAALDREFPLLVPRPRKSNTGVQKPKEGRTVTFPPTRNRAR